MTTPIEREALSDERAADLFEMAKQCGAIVRDVSITTAHSRKAVTFYSTVLEDQLAAFAARIRAEALEEAAKEAVRHTTHPDDPTNEVWQSAYNHVATEIAAAIRALVLPSTGAKK